jgi:hypothetical protein
MVNCSLPYGPPLPTITSTIHLGIFETVCIFWSVNSWLFWTYSSFGLPYLFLPLLSVNGTQWARSSSFDFSRKKLAIKPNSGITSCAFSMVSSVDREIFSVDHDVDCEIELSCELGFVKSETPNSLDPSLELAV